MCSCLTDLHMCDLDSLVGLHALPGCTEALYITKSLLYE
jgi:hypothetical protein